ncbi:MAG: hypothetical protein GY953_14035, partial [bacterium]|nr:hypothetical protein [bacterium]
AIAAYAQSLGVSECFIHPVISRDVVHFPFPDELDKNSRLSSSFKEDVAQIVSSVRGRYPGLRFSLSTTEVEASPAKELGHEPRHYPATLPARGARILTCDQNPRESVHILSNGDVVTCEVRDRMVMGNLRTKTLGEIWHGEAYRRFREEYSDGRDPACRDCPYKVAYRPSPLQPVISARVGGHAQLTRGWHQSVGEDLIWSKPEAVATLSKPEGTRSLRLHGVLPPAPAGDVNHLHIICNGVFLSSIVNRSDSLYGFDERIAVPTKGGDRLELEFHTTQHYRPFAAGAGNDARTLGFGLIHLEAFSAPVPGMPRARAITRQARLLDWV